MEYTNPLAEQAASHVKVSLALNRLDTRDLQELAQFLSNDFHRIPGNVLTSSIVLDALNKFTEATPTLTLPLPARKAIDSTPDPSRCWICRHPLDECTCR